MNEPKPLKGKIKLSKPTSIVKYIISGKLHNKERGIPVVELYDVKSAVEWFLKHYDTDYGKSPLWKEYILNFPDENTIVWEEWLIKKAFEDVIEKKGLIENEWLF